MNFPLTAKLFRVISITLVASLSQALGADRIAKAVFIEPPKGSPKTVYLITPDKGAIEVPLTSRNFSPAIELPPGDLVLPVLPRPLAEEEAVPKGAPTVKIPSTWGRTYLVFSFDKKNKVFPLKIVPINGSNSEFPLGHSRIINFSDALIAGKFNDKEVGVRPNEVKNISPPLNKVGDYQIEVRFLKKGEKEWAPLLQTAWLHNPAARQIIFVTSPATSRYPRVRALEDRGEIKEESE